MIWAVLDTNTIVSGFGWHGPPARIVDHALAGHFIVVTSAQLLGELARVLRYPKLANVFPDPAIIVDLFAEVAVIVTPHERIDVLEDEPDNRLLEAAVEAEADFVVTGDKRVRSTSGRPHVVTPKAFLDRLDAEFR